VDVCRRSFDAAACAADLRSLTLLEPAWFSGHAGMGRLLRLGLQLPWLAILWLLREPYSGAFCSTLTPHPKGST